ncbi:MAG: apolipoprotein N-acyltransferase [Spirochaetaceae bacterium]|nr:MAG: apolipoprotein N-acyltransferase [Spirochaetaceae bacterium]
MLAARRDTAPVSGSKYSKKTILTDLGILSGSALVFTASFPSFLSDAGWGLLAYVALVPGILIVNRVSLKHSWWYGAYYGFVTYLLHNYWLGNFHPLAILIVPLIYAVYYALLFPLLAVMHRSFPRFGYLAQAVVWLAYEYLRTLGFLGYAYGILGYTQYRIPAFVRFSSVTGIWGVSFIVVLPSMLIAAVLTRHAAGSPAALSSGLRRLYGSAKYYAVDAALYAVLVSAVLITGGIFLRTDYSESRMWRVALVQQDVDPHQGGITAYRESLDRSMRQSNMALATDPSIDAVIWSETSFVPPITYHLQFRPNPETFQLVRRIQDYMARQTVPFIIGNSDAVRVRGGDGVVRRVDYNAAVLFEQGRIVETYRKIHLVPFTEHFPFQRSLPWVYNLLLEFDTNFWGEGKEYTVFETSDGVRFSTPICFEDTFGYLSRGFVREGADVLVNLTNDRWAESVPAAMQHMAMGVFRSGENRRTTVRGTNGGMTAVISPNGVITEMLEPLIEGHLIADAPVYNGSTTIYTRFGDWAAYLFVFAALILSGLGVGRIFRAGRAE